jgi:hypothetical protein
LQNPSELKVSTILALAQERIRDRAHWCKLILGRNKEGFATNGATSDTVQWCARGAVINVSGIQDPWFIDPLPAEVYLDEAAVEIYGEDWKRLSATGRYFYVHINNYGRHEDVMAIFDRAIELASADEKVNSEEKINSEEHVNSEERINSEEHACA